MTNSAARGSQRRTCRSRPAGPPSRRRTPPRPTALPPPPARAGPQRAAPRPPHTTRSRRHRAAPAPGLPAPPRGDAARPAARKEKARRRHLGPARRPPAKSLRGRAAARPAPPALTNLAPEALQHPHLVAAVLGRHRASAAACALRTRGGARRKERPQHPPRLPPPSGAATERRAAAARMRIRSVSRQPWAGDAAPLCPRSARPFAVCAVRAGRSLDGATPTARRGSAHLCPVCYFRRRQKS